MLGVFVALDLFLYYAFWELSLVPMTILIATFGRTENRRRAAIKYFLYAFIPSAILLVAVLWLYVKTGTFDCRKADAARIGSRYLRQLFGALACIAGVPFRLRGKGAGVPAAWLACGRGR
jgi:NADH:ubiquinone oxidoreductase subunit 4 (subunit M)